MAATVEEHQEARKGGKESSAARGKQDSSGR